MSGSSRVPQPGCEPIPGYVLKQRLGAGGYGEVWLADAPGGLQKAVKLVFGTLDDERASGELRSLQRIRQVHHPFLLSLERIEVIEQQLVIVTELAESNLLERFQSCRRKGMDGIPRDQLLDFLRDTADALDFLWKKHNLQHLDVKPGNLLLIADRIKVADFGLIKDLHDTNQSMISGLTPIYAAPEMFDGRPDLRSDQYSLGIVYVEMLTGKVPFAGRTTGELARQHVSQAPDLESLPPPDRPIVARALAKHPRDRYGSCREFIDKLRQVGSTYVPTPSNWSANLATELSADTAADENQTNTCQASLLQTAWAQTAIQSRGARVLAPRLPAAESALGWQAPRCMFVGLGGMGCRTLNSLRALMLSKVDSRRSVADHVWLGVDTDPQALDECVSEATNGGLTSVETILLRLHKPQDYRSRDMDRFVPISRRWLYNIPRSQKTEGVRPLGALALLDNYELVAKSIALHLKDLVRRTKSDSENIQEPIRVYLTASAHGGTGSALIAEVACLVRQIMANLHYEDYRLSGILSLATVTGDSSSNLPAAAAVSCLAELDELMCPGTVYAPICTTLNTGSASGRRPFDWVTLVDGGMFDNGTNARHAVDSLADTLWIDSHTLIGNTLDQVRVLAVQSSDEADSRSWLRTLTSSRIRFSQNADLHRFARWCSNSALHRWTDFLSSEPSSNTSSEDPSPSNADSKLVLSPEMEKMYISRIFHELDLDYPALMDSNETYVQSEKAVFTESKVAASEIMARRISNDPRSMGEQIAVEISLFRRWFRGLFEQRRLSWAQLEKIHLRFVERLVDFSDCQSSVIADFISARREQYEYPSELDIQSLRDYLRRLCQVALTDLQHLRKTVEQFGKQLNSWTASIEAELAFCEGKCTSYMSATVGLPFQWKQLFERATVVLDTTLLKLAIRQCFQDQLASIFDRENSTRGQASATTINMSLPELLQLASNLVRRMMTEMKLSESGFKAIDNAQGEAGPTLDELREFFPQLSASGGKHRRLLLLDAEQADDAAGVLRKQGLFEQTTMVPSCAGEPPYVVCEATDLNVAGLLSSVLRPNGETLRLAERLHTRVDHSWLPTERLLQIGLQPVG